MRIAHLSWTDNAGGAEREMLRLSRSLNRLGVRSDVLVGYQNERADPHVHAVCRGLGGRLRASARFYLSQWLATRRARVANYSTNWIRDRKLATHPIVQNADVVCLNWVGSGFLAPLTIRALKKPVVWILSDFLPLTGGCHYPGSCVRYQDMCGACPVLRSMSARDLSTAEQNRKAAAVSQLPFHAVVSPSRFLAERARASRIFRNSPISVIPTGTNLDQFIPIDRAVARALTGVPPSDLIIGFGAVNSDTDTRKGRKQLIDALQILAQTGIKASVLVFGNRNSTADSTLPFPLRALGLLRDEMSLALAYNAMDVFVAPSLEENFPNTVLEATACGTPSVAFPIGGLPEIIKDGKTGALASAVSGAALADAITRAAAIDRAETRSDCRRLAQADFGAMTQAARYVALLGEVVEGRMRTERPGENSL